jgi:DNA-directed RNA polymerase subunit RPC12/RpoP
MIRCNHCGWENPNENAPCIKCGATLTAGTDAQLTARNTTTENFDARKTAIGCPKCGYPIRPTDERCPNCNAELKRPATSNPISGTIIATSASPDGVAAEGRRITGLLVTYSIHPQGDVFKLLEGKNSIGRDSAANISVENDAMMSERHLSILYRPVDNKFKFKDEQSSNGTFVNGTLIDEGELNNGDVITAGATKFLFISIPPF